MDLRLMGGHGLLWGCTIFYWLGGERGLCGSWGGEGGLLVGLRVIWGGRLSGTSGVLLGVVGLHHLLP